MSSFLTGYLVVGLLLTTAAYFLKKRPKSKSRIIWPLFAPEIGFLFLFIWPFIFARQLSKIRNEDYERKT